MDIWAMFDTYIEARNAVFDAVCRKGKKCGDICIPKNSECRKSGSGVKSPSLPSVSRKNMAIAAGVTAVAAGATGIALARRGGGSKNKSEQKKAPDYANKKKKQSIKKVKEREEQSMNALEKIAEKARMEEDVAFWNEYMNPKPAPFVSKIQKNMLTVTKGSQENPPQQLIPSPGKRRGRKPKNPVSPGVPMAARSSVQQKTAFTNNRNKKPKPAPINRGEWVEPTAIAMVATNSEILKKQKESTGKGFGKK